MEAVNESARSSSAGGARALTLAVMAYVTASFSATGLPPLAPFFQPEMGISRAEMGLLISAFYAGVGWRKPYLR